MEADQVLPNTVTMNSVMAGCGWQRVLQLVQGMSEKSLRADVVSCCTAISACEDASQWQHAASLWHGMVSSKLQINTVCCNSAISAIGTGDWRCALDCFRQLTVSLEPDAVSFGSGMAAAASASWGLALALGASGSCPDLAQRNIVLAECSWRPALALLGCREASLQPNGITYSNAVKTLAKDARWRDSFTLTGERFVAGNEITVSAALGACEKGQAWQSSASCFRRMTQYVVEPNDVAINSVVTAAEKAGQWQIALMLLDLESARQEGPGAQAQRAWRRGRRARLGAAPGAAAPQQLPESTLQELSTLAWAVAVAGATDRELLREIRARLQNGEAKLLPLRSLANLAWSLAMSGHDVQILRRELGARIESGSLSGLSSASSVLELLWASNFATATGSAASSSSRSLSVWAAVMRALPAPALAPLVANSGSGSIPGAGTGGMEPTVARQLPDRLVVYKPPGWQVDECGEAMAFPLSSFVRALHPRMEPPQRGFLHRLDVPSSGLLLVATSVQAFYDLQFQLATGQLTRDYIVLCHGWLPPSSPSCPSPSSPSSPSRASRAIRAIRASVTSDLHRGAPSRVTPGANSRTELKLLAHAHRAPNALCLVLVRISTGRKHQIRLHMAHVGHPTATDGIYASGATFQADRSWCRRNFLHRHFLAFRASAPQGQCEATSQLPQDLHEALCSTKVKGTWSWERPGLVGTNCVLDNPTGFPGARFRLGTLPGPSVRTQNDAQPIVRALHGAAVPCRLQLCLLKDFQCCACYGDNVRVWVHCCVSMQVPDGHDKTSL
ncbi:unnamed protein product [Effrenium voratum]|nr:unnamed protein product [Effrenium voratum]